MPMNPYQGLKRSGAIERLRGPRLARHNANESLSGIETAINPFKDGVSRVTMPMNPYQGLKLGGSSRIVAIHASQCQ